MKLLHNNEAELSRALLATKPHWSDCAVNNGPALEPGPCDCDRVEIIEGPGGYPVSAYPSVVVTVPAYTEKRPAFNEAGELTGMEDVTVPEHEEVLRLPASWGAVQQYVDFVQARAEGVSG